MRKQINEIKLSKKDKMKDYLVMFSITTTILLIFMVCTCQGAEVRTYGQLADAIYKAEGSKKAKKPYGILSVSCETEAECRRICINTIRNNKRRWENKTHGADKHKNYLSFLASRYCPIGAENDKMGLNVNWLNNVKYFLRKGLK